MKMKLTKKTKKAICIYVIALVLLYVVVEVLPKVTDIFETVQVLEPGNLTLSYETKGYFIKNEAVGIAGESGDIQYLVEEGTAIKKGYPLVAVDPVKTDKKKDVRFEEYTKRLKGYEGLYREYNSPISGVYSLNIDGYEDYFTFDRMEKIKNSNVKALPINSIELERETVIKGEPIYKVSADDKWYILCWVDDKVVDRYQEGRDVSLELPEGTVDAEVYKIHKEDSEYRVIFYLDVYYEAFAESRAEDMNIITSDNTGLLVNNKCIVKKRGKTGVYVKNKNGDYEFTEIKIIASDDKESVIEDVTFIDDEGNQVYTVDVYDEVLKHPQSALEKDLKEKE
ncbi:MAG: hypothetical protein GX663_06115 [Clostridiales bacterium]|nr:hypothetical protein [Clostridiales bacterium]